MLVPLRRNPLRGIGWMIFVRIQIVFVAHSFHIIESFPVPIDLFQPVYIAGSRRYVLKKFSMETA